MPESYIILYACGSPIIVDFEELCLNNNIEVKAIVNNQGSSVTHAILENKLVGLSQLPSIDLSIPFLCPLFSPHNRYYAVTEALKYGLKPFNLLSDRKNDLPTSFSHGVGCFINKRVVIGAQSRIRDFVFINRGATLGHHLLLEDFVSIGPGVVTGGNVTIKKGALIGAGAVILPGITIGEHVIIGAGSVVTKDVKDYSIALGNPIRVIKQNQNSF